MPSAKLVRGGVRLRDQVNKRFPGRDKSSDGWIGDAAHSSRASFHNSDSRGWVHAIDLDENMGRGRWRKGRTARILADQLIAYGASGLPGSDRILHVVYEDQVASGTYKSSFWKFRGSGYSHFQHIHVSFTAAAEYNGHVWPLPILTKNPIQKLRWRLALKG